MPLLTQPVADFKGSPRQLGLDAEGTGGTYLVSEMDKPDKSVGTDVNLDSDFSATLQSPSSSHLPPKK